MISNQPKLSKRAQQALDILANGGRMVHRLERNSYTRREQFETRFCTSAGWSSAVKGLGVKTRYELEDAGFRFVPVHHTSVSTHYTLAHAARTSSWAGSISIPLPNWRCCGTRLFA